jgi:hypothetical protein
MTDKHVLHIGAVAAFLGVLGGFAAAMVEPGRVGDANEAIRKIAEMEGWTGRWLVHLAGSMLLVTALVIVTRTFTEGPAREWSRVGQPLLVIAGALGAAEVLVGAGTKSLADGWASAPHGSELPYLTAFEAAWNTTVYLDFGAIVVVGLFELTLAKAILSSSVYPRWLGWATGVSGVVGLVGIVLELWSPVGTALNAVSGLVMYVVVVALGRSMWRRAGQTARADRPLPAAPQLGGRTP